MMIDGTGAFCVHDRVHLAGAAAGPLTGMTFAVKDLFAVEGVTACFGNPTWLGTHRPARRTAPVVARLIEAGATLTGLTLTDELALSLTGENSHYGTPVNRRCPDRVPGGSSSGSAAAVADGACDFALGTDTGGSVRVPASHCGIFGFRPTHGAISLDGVWPLAPRFDTVGWFARDAATLARVGDVLLPSMSERPSGHPARLLIAPSMGRFLDPGATPVFLGAAENLAGRIGRPLERADVEAAVPAGDWLPVYLALQNAELRLAHGRWIAHHHPSFGALIGGRVANALAVTPGEVEQAETAAAAIDALATALTADAWVVWPSAAGPAPPRGLPEAEIDAVTGRALTLGALASIAGLPQVTLPMAEVQGCPFGVSLIGPRGSDRALLAAAVTTFNSPNARGGWA